MKKPNEGEPPRDPHLALITDFTTGLATPIPPGAVILQIMDPNRADGVTPLILTKVAIRGWTFRCACGDPNCTRVLKMQAKWEGFHKAAQHVVPDEPEAE